MTPPAEGCDAPVMDLIVGGALAPAPISPRLQHPLRSGPGLRLPSFEALGIATPHPDRLHAVLSDSPLMDTAISAARRNTHSDTAQQKCLRGLGTVQFPPASVEDAPLLASPTLEARTTPILIPRDIAALTPPSESGDPAWGLTPAPFPDLMASSADDADTLDPGNSSEPAKSSGEGAVPSASTGLEHNPVGVHDLPSARSWIHDAAAVLLENMPSATGRNNPLRVLSHALPSPSPAGHVFSMLIDRIHASTPSSSTVWINVFHAIPGRFNLTDLPTSPPSTPGPAIGGDDYFTQKVFDSAVSISDYQEDLSSLPRSPRPVVPPGSVNVSIVERYVPPTSAREFQTMFDPTGPSILVDRLVELSPDGGCLVFIYPNRNGGRTFMDEYLSPILDPLLRSTVVVNGLSSDLSRILGKMVAVDQLPEHDQFLHSMTALCRRLTQPDSKIRRFQGNRSRFDLVHASAHKVSLSRDVWARDWWSKQEKPKIREAMTRFVQEAQKVKSNEYMERAATATELVGQLLAGVLQKPYPSGREPQKGVEVSVFVIRCSAG